MKILIATGLFPPDIGGPATYSKLLSAELPKRNIETDILTFGEVRELPKLIRHFAYLFKVLIRGRGADIIYAQDPVSVGLPAAMAAMILRKKFLVRIAGDYAWEQGVQRFSVKQTLDEFVNNPPLSFMVALLRFIERRVALYALRVVVPSYYLKRVVAKWGIPMEKLVVIENAYDGPLPSESKEELRKRLNISKSTILSVGRLVPWKGFMELVRTFPMVLKGGEAELLIAGDGPEREILLSEIKKLGLDGKVRLLGRLPQAVMHNYLRASDVFVLNSSYEGFSHQLLEALAMEVPVVTTDIPGNAEIIKHNDSGILVPLGNKEALSEGITLLLANRTHAEELVRGGKRMVESLSIDRMLSKLTKLIQEL